jgi:hypothetical protein
MLRIELPPGVRKPTWMRHFGCQSESL